MIQFSEANDRLDILLKTEDPCAEYNNLFDSLMTALNWYHELKDLHQVNAIDILAFKTLCQTLGKIVEDDNIIDEEDKYI